MIPLTIEQVQENEMTGVDVIKYYMPNWTDEECSFYLWEGTPFPFIPVEQLIELLNKRFL